MGRRVSEPVTAELAAKIWHLRLTTDLVQHEIAAELHVNQGRISEVLAGKSFPELRPS